jgi:hypothetical protein
MERAAIKGSREYTKKNACIADINPGAFLSFLFLSLLNKTVHKTYKKPVIPGIKNTIAMIFNVITNPFLIDNVQGLSISKRRNKHYII